MNVKKQMLKAIPGITKNKYFNWYCSIIERALNWRPNLESEDHHYIPNSIMENNDTVALSYREHFICHMLLTKFLRGNPRRKMLHAVNMMIDCNKYEKSSSRLYESLKEDLKYARHRPLDLIRHSYEDGSFSVAVSPKGLISARGEVISSFDSIDDLLSASETMVYHPTNTAMEGYTAITNYSDTARAAAGRANSIHQSGPGNSQYGTQWIYSEKEKTSKKIRVTDVIPKGWQKGRKIKFEDDKNE